MARRWISLGFALLNLLVIGRAGADTLPQTLVPAELARLDADQEAIGGVFPGLLLLPRGLRNSADEEKRAYHAACYGYMAERRTGGETITGYSRRFIVHAPEADALPLARKVARLLLLCLGENRERLKSDHPTNLPTMDVWLTQQAGSGLSPDIGGKQARNQIYLYALTADRSPIEWAREVAHEYGHYALPGVSGFKQPEEWANGVLGERLFLRWINEDLQKGRLRPEEIPFVTAAELDMFLSKQVTPLIRRIARDGAEERSLNRKDAAGMDAYTGLVLYLDAVYGSKALLDALAYTTPKQSGVFTQASDFLRGALASLNESTEVMLNLPFATKESKSDALMVYLPRGEFAVTMEGGVRSWQVPTLARGVTLLKKDLLRVGIPGWQKLSVTLAPPEIATPRLILRRRGVDVP